MLCDVCREQQKRMRACAFDRKSHCPRGSRRLFHPQPTSCPAVRWRRCAPPPAPSHVSMLKVCTLQVSSLSTISASIHPFSHLPPSYVKRAADQELTRKKIDIGQPAREIRKLCNVAKNHLEKGDFFPHKHNHHHRRRRPLAVPLGAETHPQSCSLPRAGRTASTKRSSPWEGIIVTMLRWTPTNNGGDVRGEEEEEEAGREGGDDRMDGGERQEAPQDVRRRKRTNAHHCEEQRRQGRRPPVYTMAPPLGRNNRRLTAVTFYVQPPYTPSLSSRDGPRAPQLLTQQRRNPSPPTPRCARRIPAIHSL